VGIGGVVAALSISSSGSSPRLRPGSAGEEGAIASCAGTGALITVGYISALPSAESPGQARQ
jgi:hypothetical protein